MRASSVLALLACLVAALLTACAQSPFPSIPASATPFFIDDSYSLEVEPGNPWPHYPGVVNTNGTFGAGQS